MKPTKCSFPECGKPHYAKGLCQGHYTQQRKGQELRPLQPRLTLEQRFWVKVNKTDDCWLWTGGTGGAGYGKIWADGRKVYVHRISWELANGPIPEGKVIDHRCHNKCCVNPEHLRVVTTSQNMQHRAGISRNNVSGVRGVHWDKRDKAWVARAMLNGRCYLAGYYSTPEAADAAARALRADLFTHDDHEQWVSMQKAKEDHHGKC